MKKETHPQTGLVLFRDASSGDRWLCTSTSVSDRMEEFEGKQYPTIVLETSAYSHPYYTEKQTFIDTAGRVEKFKKRFAKYQKQD